MSGKKVKIRNLPFVYPIPTILAGSLFNGNENYTTLGNCGIISVEPPVIYISSHKSHYANLGIIDNGYFSVNIPSVDQVSKVDYCGLVSGHKIDKSDVFKSFYGEIKLAPLVIECPINLLCKVIQAVDVHDMQVFIGEVIEVYVTDVCLTNGFPDTKKVNPLIYMMDNLYWSIGDIVGNGFRDGTKYIKESSE